MNIVPDVPAELKEALDKNRCAAFVGAGLSIGAGFPSWESLLTILAQQANDQGIINTAKKEELFKLIKTPSKWLMVAQEIHDLYGKGAFQSEVGKIFDRVTARPTKTHELITKIPFQFVVTTNYDQLIENSYFPKFSRIPKVFTHQDTPDFADALWKQEFFILKAHGDLQRKSSIVLTEKDYRTVIYSSPGYRAVLTAIFTTKTMLFLGASLSDPEIGLLLQSMHDAFHGSGTYHYAVIADNDFSETEADHWRKNYNVRCIRYTASTNHPELDAFLAKMVP